MKILNIIDICSAVFSAQTDTLVYYLRRFIWLVMQKKYNQGYLINYAQGDTAMDWMMQNIKTITATAVS